jgi:putative phosphoserine phosphatase/1-acylglycerol-3-phosphate O-acyltransferase
MKELVVFDVDGTLLSGYTQQHFLRFMRRRGHIGAIPYYRILGRCLIYRFSPSRDPRPAMEFAFGLLRGWRQRDVEELAAQCFRDCLATQLYDDAVRLVTCHAMEGRHIVLLSTVPELLVRPLAEWLGADVVATRLESEAGVLTGRLDGPVLSGDLKSAAIEGYLQTHDYRHTFGYGDAASDLAFLSKMDYPHAVNPDRGLAREASGLGWPILRFQRLREETE